MSRRARRILSTTLGVLAVVIAPAALSWACTPSAYLTLGTGAATAGTPVTVAGQGFISGPVQISWSGAGGAVLGTATGPSFSTTVTIPSAAPGVYYVQATARGPDGRIVGEASRALRVTASATQAPAAAEPPSVRVREKRSATRRGEGEGRARSEAQVTQTQRSVQAPAATPAAVERSAAGGAAAERRGEPAAREAAGRRSSSDRSARGASDSDIWSGFDKDGRGAALANPSGPAQSTGAGLVPSVALLALGLVALVAGCMLAAVRRRRAAPGQSL